MKRTIAILVAGLALLGATQARAYNTFNTTFTDPSGLTFGSYLSGSEGQGLSFITNYGYDNSIKPGAGTPDQRNGNQRDWYWIQDASGPFDAPALGLIYDLGGQANQVVVFPIIDHDPMPQEAWEYNVYLSNDLSNWTPATLTDLYTEGWSGNPDVADGYTTVWKLAGNGTARYASVTAGNNGNPDQSFYYESADNEIDAIAGLRSDGTSIPVPEPKGMALMGMGLLGLGLVVARRRLG